MKKNFYGLYKKDDPDAGFFQVGSCPNPVLLQSRLPDDVGVLFSETVISDIEHKPQGDEIQENTDEQIAARIEEIKTAETIPPDKQPISAAKLVAMLLEKELITEEDVDDLRMDN